MKQIIDVYPAARAATDAALLRTALKCSMLILIVFHGEPDIVAALVQMIGRIAT